MKLVVKYTFSEVKQYIWTLNMQMQDFLFLYLSAGVLYAVLSLPHKV